MEELEDTTKSFSHILGEGAYGIVYLGKNIRYSATSVAVKVLNKVQYMYILYTGSYSDYKACITAA